MVFHFYLFVVFEFSSLTPNEGSLFQQVRVCPQIYLVGEMYLLLMFKFMTAVVCVNDNSLKLM